MEAPNLDQVRYVLNLATRITAKEAELKYLLKQWYQLFPNISPRESAPKESLPEPQPLVSLDERIVGYLEHNADREFNVSTLMQELQLSSVSIGTQLSKLTRDGKIIRSGRGLYKAKDTKSPNNYFSEVKEEEPTEVGS